MRNASFGGRCRRVVYERSQQRPGSSLNARELKATFIIRIIFDTKSNRHRLLGAATVGNIIVESSA